MTDQAKQEPVVSVAPNLVERCLIDSLNLEEFVRSLKAENRQALTDMGFEPLLQTFGARELIQGFPDPNDPNKFGPLPDRAIVVRLKQINPRRMKMSLQEVTLSTQISSGVTPRDHYVKEVWKKMRSSSSPQQDDIIFDPGSLPRTRLDLDASLPTGGTGVKDCLVVFDAGRRFKGFFAGRSTPNPAKGEYVSGAILGDVDNPTGGGLPSGADDKTNGDPFYQAIVVKKRGGIIRTVMCYCPARSPGEPARKYGIGLNIADPDVDENDDVVKFQTGIIIDPKVKNDG